MMFRLFLLMLKKLTTSFWLPLYNTPPSPKRYVCTYNTIPSLVFLRHQHYHPSHNFSSFKTEETKQSINGGSSWFSFLCFCLCFLACMASTCSASGTFSALGYTLVVKSSPKSGKVLKAGEEQITVTWSFINTFPAGTDSTSKTVKVKLCYAPISQVDRA